jgi:hypothetical protein
MFVIEDPRESVSRKQLAHIRSFIATVGHRKKRNQLRVTARSRSVAEAKIGRDDHIKSMSKLSSAWRPPTFQHSLIQIADVGAKSRPKAEGSSSGSDGREQSHGRGQDPQRSSPSFDSRGKRCSLPNKAWRLGPSSSGDATIPHTDQRARSDDERTNTPALSLVPDCFDGLRTDPFGHFSRKAMPVMEFFVRTVVPRYAAALKVFNVKSFVPQPILEILQSEDCLPATTAAVQAAIGAIQQGAETSPQTVTQNHSQGLARLRARLSRLNGQIDAVSIMTVVMLLVTTGMTDDEASWRVHARSIGHIVQAAGGFSRLDNGDCVKTNLLQWDVAWAYKYGRGLDLIPGARRQAQREFLTWPLDASTARLAANVPSGFLSLIETGFVSHQTLVVITRAVDASLSTDFVQDHDMYHTEHRPFNDLWEACPCLALDNENGNEDKRGTAALERLICQALLLFCLHNMTKVPRGTGVPMMVSCLYDVVGVLRDKFTSILLCNPDFMLTRTPVGYSSDDDEESTKLFAVGAL